MPHAREPNPNITPLVQSVIRHLPASSTLDETVLAWEPAPVLVRASLSPHVVEKLSRRRNLYGPVLHAASTEDPSNVIDSTYYQKVKVRRALALNSHVSLEQSHQLAQDARARRDGGQLLALIQHNPYFADILTTQPDLLDMLSMRTGQPGPAVLGRRLGDLEPYEVPELTNSVYRLGLGGASLRTGHAQFMSVAVNHYLNLLERDETTAPLHLLVVMSRTLIPAAAGNRRTALPHAYLPQVEALPGSDVLALTRSFTVSDTPSTDYSKNPYSFLAGTEGDPDLSKASHASIDLIRSQPLHPAPSQGALGIEHWSHVALDLAGAWIAPQIATFGQLHTINTLISQWSGNLDELTQTSLAL